MDVNFPFFFTVVYELQNKIHALYFFLQIYLSLRKQDVYIFVSAFEFRYQSTKNFENVLILSCYYEINLVLGY